MLIYIKLKFLQLASEVLGTHLRATSVNEPNIQQCVNHCVNFKIRSKCIINLNELQRDIEKIWAQHSQIGECCVIYFYNERR